MRMRKKDRIKKCAERKEVEHWKSRQISSSSREQALGLAVSAAWTG
jgi:hypothetical protein